MKIQLWDFTVKLGREGIFREWQLGKRTYVKPVW
jgi:hypothetical protein